MLAWITHSFFWTRWTLYMIPFSLLGIRKDRRAVSFFFSLPVVIGAFWLCWTLYAHRAYPWYALAQDLFPYDKGIYNWEGLFRRIPFNNGWVFRLIRFPALDSYFRFVYRGAFYLNLWTCVFRGFFARDPRKMIRYMFSGFIIQMVMIMPLYYFLTVREVWWVLGEPDHLMRHLHGIALVHTIANDFPSMHTSCAVGVLLVARDERSALFRRAMTIYCASIVFATLYLEVHWVLDVVAGIALAWGGVWAGDRILGWIWDKWPAAFVSWGTRRFRVSEGA